MKMARRLLGVAFTVAVLVGGWRFANGNLDPVRVNYLFDTLPPIALWQVIAGAVAAGAGITAALMGLGLIRSRLETRRYRKALLNLETEIHQLRNLPLVGNEQGGLMEGSLAASSGGEQPSAASGASG